MKKEDIEKRLENIEEILRLLLINSVLGSNETDGIQEKVLNDARELLTPLGMKNLRLNYIENECYIFAEIDEADTLKMIKSNYNQATSLLNEIKLVLTFEKLHPKRKKSFEEASISYHIKGGETRIF